MSPTRREFLRGGLALAALSPAAHLAFAEDVIAPNTLWYQDEAKRWLEALPVGNGRIGGMVFGGVDKERIALSESTVWSGAPSASDVNPEGLKHLNQIRQLLFQEDYIQARKLCEEHLLSRPTSFGTNLPLLDLVLNFDHAEKLVQYQRSLVLVDGIARVDYQRGNHHFRRETFSSNPDNVLVVHLTSESTGQLDLNASFEDMKLPGEVIHFGDDTFIFRGHAFETLHSNGKQGVEVECHIRLFHHGGTASIDEDQLRVRGANSVMLLVAIATSYGGGAPAKYCDDVLQAASAKAYADLRRAHVADHQALFHRVQIDLDRAREQRTSRRIIGEKRWSPAQQIQNSVRSSFSMGAT